MSGKVGRWGLLCERERIAANYGADVQTGRGAQRSQAQTWDNFLWLELKSHAEMLRPAGHFSPQSVAIKSNIQGQSMTNKYDYVPIKLKQQVLNP